MAQKQLNSPLASSAGRLFDAVAGVLDVCRETAGYEGQAAVELEALATPHFAQQADAGYGYEYQEPCLCWHPLWHELLEDLKAGVARGVVAARFHQGLAQAVAETAGGLSRQHDLDRVVLTGGVFQNRLLLERTAHLLREQDLSVWIPQQMPMNDGGLSLGQAALGAVSLAHGS
jgi:hydrogenase maturation protein HypF